MTKPSVPAVIRQPLSTAVAVLPPGEESKAEKFKRLANNRVSVVLHQIELVGNLAAPSYDYTNADVTVIETAITRAVKRAIGRLRDRKTPAPSRTTLF